MNGRVKCVHKRRAWPAYIADSVIRAKESLPFAESNMGRYTHRVRYVELHTCQKESHLAAGCWCGMTVLICKRKPGRIISAPSDGFLICATCEGRAIGSGQLGARVIAGREVMFRPHGAAV